MSPACSFRAAAGRSATRVVHIVQIDGAGSGELAKFEQTGPVSLIACEAGGIKA
jgi:hypothetical protein